jgi:hypothetical protein
MSFQAMAPCATSLRHGHVERSGRSDFSEISSLGYNKQARWFSDRTFARCPLSASWPVQDFEGDGHLGLRNMATMVMLPRARPFSFRSDMNSMPRLKDEESFMYLL